MVFHAHLGHERSPQRSAIERAAWEVAKPQGTDTIEITDECSGAYYQMPTAVLEQNDWRLTDSLLRGHRAS
jgi:hypothetical protein